MSKTRVIVMFAVAICAFAVASVPASAFFAAKKYPQQDKTKATSMQVFTVNGVPLECEEVKAPAVLNQESSQYSVKPEFSKCTATSSKLAATVTNEGCYFNFHQAKGVFTGTVSVVCQPQKQILITIPALSGCKIDVGGYPQVSQKNQFLPGITYANVAGPPKKVEIKAGVPKITYTAEGCGLGGIPNGENNNSEYKGSNLTEANDGVTDQEVV
jgi:hypothetical protein